MRILRFFFVFVLVGLVFSCKPKIGVHEIIDFEDGKTASDEVYVKFLSEQIDQYPEEGDNYVKLATIYSRQRNPTKAISLLQRGEKENPNDMGILIHLAELYLQNEDVENLSSSLRKIRGIDPDNMDFLKLSAGYSLLLMDYTNAIFFANRAILANPYDDENYYLRGQSQLVNRDSLSALISLGEAFKMKSSYKNFARVFEISMAVEDIEKAKSYLDAYTSLYPTELLCYQWGAYFRATGALDTAKQILRNCLIQSPEESKVNFELAKIYYQQNKLDSTLYFVNAYLNAKPRGTSGQVLKAKTFERMNYFTDARNLYKSALKIDSTSTLARRGLENLERKVAYLRLVKRKEEVQKQVETLKPLNSKEIN